MAMLRGPFGSGPECDFIVEYFYLSSLLWPSPIQHYPSRTCSSFLIKLSSSSTVLLSGSTSPLRNRWVIVFRLTAPEFFPPVHPVHLLHGFYPARMSGRDQPNHL